MEIDYAQYFFPRVIFPTFVACFLVLIYLYLASAFCNIININLNIVLDLLVCTLVSSLIALLQGFLAIDQKVK